MRIKLASHVVLTQPDYNHFKLVHWQSSCMFKMFFSSKTADLNEWLSVWWWARGGWALCLLRYKMFITPCSPWGSIKPLTLYIRPPPDVTEPPAEPESSWPQTVTETISEAACEGRFSNEQNQKKNKVVKTKFWESKLFKELPVIYF